MNKYEWRDFSEFELCASGTFWKSIGDKMEIDLSPLPSYQQGWADGLHWLKEVKIWSEQYEKDNMVPAITNRDLALSHLDVIIINSPGRLNLIGKNVVSVIVGDRLRKAMMLPDPPRIHSLAIDVALGCRKQVLRHLVLPRPEIMRKHYISSEPEDNGRYSSREYLSHPWYVKPTFKRRWGARAWMTRLLGRKLPGDDGNKYNPEGYLISEVGPSRLAKCGAAEVHAEMLKIRRSRPGGCPFSASNKSKYS